MNKQLLREKFKNWSKELCRWGRDDWFIHWIFDDVSENEYFGRYCIYTRNFTYTLTAKWYKDHDYLACGVNARMPRAGEDWTRGNDLPDGEFSRKTWEKIKNAIIQYELVKIAKPVQRMADETPEIGPSIGD